MKISFPGGVWPTMITPYTEQNSIDYNALEKLVNWYIENGSSGLFSVCQSSEMFYLSIEERKELARFVKQQAKGRVPVIASGHISDSFDDQVRELNTMAESGADAIILITNRLTKEEESDDLYIERLDKLINKLPKELPLGMYECPYPYKKVLSAKIIKYCAQSNRFYFLKDTSCDMNSIHEKLELIKGSNLKLYNANTATLLDSLKAGATGYCGVMANFHPDLYAWLLDNWQAYPEKAEELQSILTMCSFIEFRLYPVNSKYYLQLNGLDLTINSRKCDKDLMNDTLKSEAKQLYMLSEKIRSNFKI